MTAPATAPTTATKSTVITNLDATPPVRATAGKGGFGILHRAQGTITPAASQATSVLNRMVRIPSNAVVTRVSIIADAAATTLTGSVGLWYSDSANDGTSILNQGNLVAISSAFFAATLAMATYAYVPGTDPAATIGLSAPVDISFANSGGAYTDGQYLPSQSALPIWQAVSNSLVLQTTPVGAFCLATGGPSGAFTRASAGAVVYVQGTDPGGFFDICIQLTSTGSAANVAVTLFADFVTPGP
jgi:hypothetical protein